MKSVKDQANEPPVVLHSLTPAFDRRSHGLYLDLLTDALDRPDVRNIALSGRYGIGKSSVLRQLQASRSGKVISLSMSSLAFSKATGDDSKSDDTTKLIQKEIVKQILYREPSHRMKGSRFRRIEPFRRLHAHRMSILTGLGAAILIELFGLVEDIEQMLLSDADRPVWLHWVVFSGVALVIWFLTYHILSLLHGRFRLQEASVGSAAIKLSDSNNSYLDEYLDEIIHFFSQTHVRIVIFEDLDRFGHPRIFETLRELNNILNNTESIGSGPVRFIYAIRDSIFEISSEGAIQSTASRQHLSATDRTKFFDLIIPLVPFISPSAIQTLVQAEFADLDAVYKPSENLLALVAERLTDMRLIKNIRNEYAVFASRLRRTNLEWLDKDHLFAIVVYKNLYLADFDRISMGVSNLNSIYRFYREIVNYQITVADQRMQSLSRQRSDLERIDLLSETLGRRLESVLDVLGHLNRVSYPKRTEFSVETRNDASAGWPGTAQRRLSSDAQKTGFWADIVDETMAVRAGSLRFGVDQLSVLLDCDLRDAFGVEMEKFVELEIRKSRDLRDFLGTATMVEVITRQDLIGESSGWPGSISLLAFAEKTVGPGPALELLKNGWIDEYFALYATEYGGSLSLRGMNFVINNVEQDVFDPNYSFGGPDGNGSADIDMIARDYGERFFGGQSVYNIEVFDHFLVAAPERLRESISQLASDADQTNFLPIYLEHGEQATALIKILAREWGGIFEYILVPLVEGGPRGITTRGAWLESRYSPPKWNTYLRAAIGAADNDTVRLMNNGGLGFGGCGVFECVSGRFGLL